MSLDAEERKNDKGIFITKNDALKPIMNGGCLKNTRIEGCSPGRE